MDGSMRDGKEAGITSFEYEPAAGATNDMLVKAAGRPRL